MPMTRPFQSAPMFSACPYILPVHCDLSGSEANPDELDDRLHGEILKSYDWFYFFNRKRVENTN
jgi:hypothetical protein